MEANRRKVRKKNHYLPLILAAVFLLLVSGSFTLFYYLPGYSLLEYHGNPPPLLLLGDRIQDAGSARLEGPGEVLVSLEFFLTEIDPLASWYPEENTLSISTADKLIRMNTEQLTAYINRTAVELSLPLQEIDGVLYLPLNFLLPYYPFEMTYHSETDIVILDKAEIKPLPARVLDKARLRQAPSPRSPYYHDLEEGEEVFIFSEAEGWYRVRTAQGLLGYMPKKAAVLEGALTLPSPLPEYPRRTSWRPMGEKINLTWEFAYRKRDTSTIPPMPGVNVVSPTWFHLKDEEGNLRNYADPHYVAWAHARGYQVWALVTNDFKRDLTHEVLKSPAKRQKVIDQLLAFSSLYNLDGINIDFENMHFPDRDLLTQFMRELTPLAHEQGLTVSIDVTMISNSLNWSRIYDRPALAEIVDYVALMAYDEHWASSPVAGPVASLPWVERGLQAVLMEVPPEKLLLGMPFYARIWKEEMLEGGDVEVSANAYSMARVQETLKQKKAEVNWDDRAKQHYAEYQEGDILYRVWVEDAESIRQRVELVHKYNLAGVASWRRGFEEPEIWQIIQDTLTSGSISKTE
jgi:spore germination protein YaaH